MSNDKKQTTDKTYRGYPVNNGKLRNFSCYTKTLEQVIDQVEYTMAKHGKGLFVRIDVRNERESEKKIMRKDMTRIIENTRRGVERKYKNSPNKPDMTITWTTEKDDENPHFHCFVGANGNAIHNGYSILKIMNNYVKKILGTQNDGIVEYCKSNGKYGKLVDRGADNFEDQIHDAVYMGSYLAKTNTKEDRPKGARVSSTTRLPADWTNSSGYEELKRIKETFDGLGATLEQTPESEPYDVPPDESIWPGPDELSGFENVAWEDDFTVMAPPQDDIVRLTDEDPETFTEGIISGNISTEDLAKLMEMRRNRSKI